VHRFEKIHNKNIKLKQSIIKTFMLRLKLTLKFIPEIIENEIVILLNFILRDSFGLTIFGYLSKFDKYMSCIFLFYLYSKIIFTSISISKNKISNILF
jgi:hypothetical protein